MAVIKLTTFIAAPVERVFDLARSIDVRKYSMKKYAEVPVDGRITGLIEKGETITWTAKHLFKIRRLSIQITNLEKPFLFIDEVVKGDFTKMKHEHHFKSIENGTIMIDHVYFEIKYNVIGKLFSSLYLTSYIKKMLTEKNEFIKEAAETNRWKHFLNSK